MHEQKNIFKKIIIRGQANMRLHQNQMSNQGNGRQYIFTSSILPARKTKEVMDQNNNQRSNQGNKSIREKQSIVQHFLGDRKYNLTILEEMINSLEFMEYVKIKNAVVRINLIICKVECNYMVQLAQIIIFLNIIDGGTYTHVLVANWITLFTIDNDTPLVDLKVLTFKQQESITYLLNYMPF